MTDLVLASASPARLTTLRNAGVEPTVRVSDVDEDAVVADARERYGDLEVADVALLLARAKCEAVVSGLEREADLEGAPLDLVVLGCDSVLEHDGGVWGKPGTVDAARARWATMSGARATLHTGHWVIDLRDENGTGATTGAVASTVVHFAELDDEEIAAYAASGEPERVAGAFTIDGLGGPYVRAVEGDPHNVVGVSLPLLREMLGELGIAWHSLWTRGRVE